MTQLEEVANMQAVMNAVTDRTEKQFSEAEIDKMRSALAKMWRQSKSQVTDTEALFYLRAGSKAKPYRRAP